MNISCNIKKLSFIVFLWMATVLIVRGQDSTKIKALLNEVNYGVPSSPAFELLPNKPSEVTHLTSAKDIAAHASTFVNGGKLQAGVAVDARPFASLIGSLTEYQKHPFKQILWRSVVSVGTASETQQNSDVYLGAGLRIPLIDKGDLRSDPRYTDLLEAYQLLATGTYPVPEIGETGDHYQARVAQLKDFHNMKKLRDSLLMTKWNAFRLDIGLAGSERAASGYLKSDSLYKDRLGVWLAVGLPVTKLGQVTVSGNTAWINKVSDTSEVSRSVVGARARFFITDGLSFSGEYARIYSLNAVSTYNENWNHFAVVVEFKIPLLGGWASLAYGGDSHHRTDQDAKFALTYAIYSDRIIKR